MLDKLPLKISQERVVLFVMALLLVGLERVFPRIPLFPWMKLGLVHIVTMVWIIRFGVKEALVFTFLRLWVGAFFFGLNLFTLGVGGLGGLVSTAAMGLCWHYGRSFVGLVGMAMVGATVHNATQLLLLWLFFAEGVFLSVQIPVMLGASLLTGAITGAGAWVLLGQTEKSDSTVVVAFPELHCTASEKWISLLLLLWAVATFFLTAWWFLVGSFVALALVGITLWRRPLLWLTIRRHWLFLVVLLLSVYLGVAGWQWDKQALQGSLTIVGRLLFWLYVGLFLHHFKAEVFLFQGVQRIMGERHPVVQSTLVVLILFPAMIEAASTLFSTLKWNMLLHPVSSLFVVMERAEQLVASLGDWQE